jgi:hypothetical protein
MGALFATALVGSVLVLSIAVGPAAAVTFCKANQSPCSEKNSYPVPTEFVATLQKATSAVFSGTPSVSCGEAGWTGETTVAGTPLLGQGTSVTFGSCGGGCTSVEARNLPWRGEVEATTPGNGTVTVTGSKEGNPSVKLSECLSGATCFYGFTTATAEVEGGETSTFTIVQTLNREAGSNKVLCALTNAFTAKYRLITPTEPIFISALP